MKTEYERTFDAARFVDQRRRRFLGTLLAVGGAVAAIPSMTPLAKADEPADAGKGKAGTSGRGGAAADPEALAARLIDQFDTDGDNALNQAELAAALKSMRGRGQRGAGGGAPGEGGSKRGRGGRGGGRGRSAS